MPKRPPHLLVVAFLIPAVFLARAAEAPSAHRKVKVEIQVVNLNPSAGKLKPRKTVKVALGKNRTFRARPKKGNLAVIRLDGRDVAQGEIGKRVRYKLVNVTAPHTIESLFVPEYTPPAIGGSLNDTGVTRCATATTNDLACNDAAAGTDQYPGQDAERGRDVTESDAADGHAGFSFVKLDASGVPLPDQSAAFATTPWSCVLDRTTQLTWEVRPDDGGLRDKDWRYSWYDSTGVGGGHGRGRANGGTCGGTGNCDTEKYPAAVNVAELCGFSDWRLPTRSELLSLVDFGGVAAPLLDAAYFPDAVTGTYWTSSRDSFQGPWSVDFTDGTSHADTRFDAHPVRLVRGGS